MNSSTATVTEIDDGALADLAVDLLDAILSAADVDTIGVSNWWDRATNALLTGAATGTCVREVVTRMAGKLQITSAFPERVTATIVRVGDALADPEVFGRWRRIAERDAVYIAALVRLRRSERREKKQKPAAKPAPVGPVNVQEGIPF